MEQKMGELEIRELHKVALDKNSSIFLNFRKSVHTALADCYSKQSIEEIKICEVEPYKLLGALEGELKSNYYSSLNRIPEGEADMKKYVEHIRDAYIRSVTDVIKEYNGRASELH